MVAARAWHGDMAAAAHQRRLSISCNEQQSNKWRGMAAESGEE